LESNLAPDGSRGCPRIDVEIHCPRNIELPEESSHGKVGIAFRNSSAFGFQDGICRCVGSLVRTVGRETCCRESESNNAIVSVVGQGSQEVGLNG
jgi:hypothetical protein